MHAAQRGRAISSRIQDQCTQPPCLRYTAAASASSVGSGLFFLFFKTLKDLCNISG